MPPVAEPLELTEEEQRHALNTGILMQRIAKLPGMRHKVLGLIKEAAPDFPIPELDLTADMDRRVADRTKPIEDSNASLRSELDALKHELARKDMRGKLNLDEDELVEVENLAREGKIGDVEYAAEYHRLRQNALGVPRGTRDPGAQDYQARLRKINPRDQKAIKRAVIDEGARVARSLRRAG